MYQAIVFSTAALLCALVLFLFRGKKEATFNIFLKSITLLFCAVGFFRFFLPDAFIYVINGTRQDSTVDVLQSILRWGYYTCYSVLPMAVFYNSRFFRNVASYVCMPFAMLSAIFFDDFMDYFLSDTTYVGFKIQVAPGLRYALFVLELVLAISIPLLLQIKKRHIFGVKNLKEWLNFIIDTPLLILIATPAYVPQSFLGHDRFTPSTFGTYHLIWIAVLFVVTLGLYYAFRFRSFKERYQLCMFLTILLFFHYNSLYLMGVTIKRLPFQLCNIAAYFYIIAMVFKLEKMFHFCFLANIVGTLIAILMPDFSVGDYSFWNAHYIFEHSLVLIIPALVMGLRIFKRIELKSFKYYLIGFTAYFLFAFISGTIINGYADNAAERVNYFFMFDRDVAFDYFPFLTFTENFHVEFGRFEVYPLIISIIYVGFTLLTFLFYLLVRFCYKLEDDHLQLRLSGIDIYEKITHRTSKRPKEFID